MGKELLALFVILLLVLLHPIIVVRMLWHCVRKNHLADCYMYNFSFRVTCTGCDKEWLHEHDEEVDE